MRIGDESGPEVKTAENQVRDDISVERAGVDAQLAILPEASLSANVIVSGAAKSDAEDDDDDDEADTLQNFDGAAALLANQATAPATALTPICYIKECGCPGNKNAPSWCDWNSKDHMMSGGDVSGWCYKSRSICEGNCQGTWCEHLEVLPTASPPLPPPPAAAVAPTTVGASSTAAGTHAP